MSKLIIGIHGLANKPPREVLEDWWKKSIVEGLHNRGMADPEFDYRMVYWADRLYQAQLHNDEFFSFDALYNEEPYTPAKAGDLREYRDSWTDTIRARVADVAGSMIDAYRSKFGDTALAQWLLGKVVKDLAFYFDEERRLKTRSGEAEMARRVLDNELKAALVETQGTEVLLIAHSMGSIIAYNVLRDLGQSHPDMEIARFVTIGAPLGLPYIKDKISEERGYDPVVRTPSIVTESWVNFADRKDPVALDIRLRDDYTANKRGIRVQDDLVCNDYHTLDDKGDPKHNHHKSYGYLRTPELADHIKAFLQG